jgi:hypothetical protein
MFEAILQKLGFQSIDDLTPAERATWTTSAGSTNTQGSSIIATFKANAAPVIQFSQNWLMSWDW